MLRAIAIAGFVAATLACAPQDDPPATLPEDLVAQYAAARCGAMFRCECDPAGWIDLAMCTAAMHARYDAQVLSLREHGGEYDAGCLAAVIEYWSSPDACGDPIDTPGVPYCALVIGDQPEHAPCGSMTTTSFSASSCAAGLYCRGGETCEASATLPSIELGLGERCSEAEYACVDGTYCDPGTERCTSPQGAGAACDLPPACDDETWCAGLEAPDIAGTCTPRGAPGDACASAVAWDTRPCAPEAGEPAIPHYCVGMTCTERVPAACGPWL